ncbi:hypothetical protein BGZ58_010078 [Dissophora ornata]|nr:hypothetical protein BGZ58_010078 [Dissophora ornata]
MAIQEPTLLQRNFIPPALTNKDVLIRDTTGSGKTFGILLALLSKPRKRLGPKNLPGITSVIVVPNQELAFQLLSWAKSLLPTMDEEMLQEMIQVIVTPSPSSSSPLIPDEFLDNPKGRHRRGNKSRRRSLSPPSRGKAVVSEEKVTPVESLPVDEQIELLSKKLPHVLVATPLRLWELLQRGVLDLSGVETLVLDEVDHLIRLPKRYASQREILNRDRHPKPAELAVLEIMRSAQAVGRNLPEGDKTTIQGDGVEKDPKETTGSDRIQLIAASATMNRPMRYWLEKKGWVQDPEWVDTTKSVILPSGIEHHCVVIGQQSIRNMRLESDQNPWRVRNSGDESKQASEIDWAEKDQAWQKTDKDASWKEQQLAAPGVAPGLETAVEKFRDDDDRMLEGVATACMLDNVENACVFFCSSFSLNQLATRLEADFGLSVEQINNAFGIQQDNQNPRDPLEYRSMYAKTQPRNKGIYIAHESNARGLDLPGLSHVYIVGLPSSPSSYVHMAGRTGRMGQKGQVVTIIREDEHLEDRARTLFKSLSVDIKPFVHVE